MRPRFSIHGGVVLALAGCHQPDISSHETAEVAPRLSGTTQPAAHPSASTLVVTGQGLDGESVEEGCHAVLIAPRIALTAAHCFKNIWPELNGELRLFGQTVDLGPSAGVPWTDRVHIKLEAITQPGGWQTPFGGVKHAEDLATIKLNDDASSSYAVAKIWAPWNPLNLSWQGVRVTLAGHTGTFGQPAIGSQLIDGLVTSGGGLVLRGGAAPNGLQGGDSGGGAFLVPSVQFGGGVSSGSLGVDCTEISAGGSGDEVLVGIASRGGSENDWAPTFTQDNRTWIAQQTTQDVDGDGWCDDEDNCTTIANTDQENCNAIAESATSWGFDGTPLGDACDPAPCASPALHATSFVSTGVIQPWGGGRDTLCWAELGRVIQDRIIRVPTYAIGSGAVTLPSATAYFCACVDSNGAPSSDPAICSAAPNHCRLDPAELSKPEGGGAMDPDLDGVTFWHAMTLQTSGGTPVAQPLAITYESGAPLVDHTWAYADDFAAWAQAGWFDVPPPSPRYGPGTDLGGIVWARDVSLLGTAAHGKPNCSGDPTCSLVDGFMFGVEPDPTGESVTCTRIPATKPPPWWTYCPACLEQWSPLQALINPFPFITLHAEGEQVTQWRDGTARAVTDAFTPALRELLSEPGLLFIGPSEPLAAHGYPGVPRGFAMDAEGVVRGHVTASDGMFDWVSSELALPVERRSGLAGTFSMLTRALYVVSGSTLAQFAFDTGDLTSIDLDQRFTAPLSVLRSMNDGAIWVVQNVGRHLEVSRIEVDQGRVTTVELQGSAGNDRAWLVQAEDGGIALLASDRSQHRLWRLQTLLEDGIQQDLIATEDGPIAHAPTVDHGSLHASITVATDRGSKLLPVTHALVP